MKLSKYFISLLLMIFTILLGCSKENYTITFCYEDQSIYKTIKVNSSEVVELDNLFKEGYVFIGWYNNDNKVESPVRFYENTKLIARFVEENHNHIFIDGVCYCGEISKITVIKKIDTDIEEIEISYNTVLEEFEKPYLENHQFIGWFVGENEFDFSKPITSEVIIYAKFEEHTHEYINGVCLCGEIAKIKVIKKINDYVEEIEIPYNSILNEFESPLLDGFKFIGWFVKEDNFDFSKPITSEVIIYAKFVETFEVTFEDYDGNIIDIQYIIKGSDAILPINPNREYYEFTGWDVDHKNIQCDLHIKAMYKPLDIEFNIEYLIDDSYWYYKNKDEMILDFLNDFYDFVNPTETRLTFINGFSNEYGLWINYIGGSESKINKLLYNNDIEADNEDYFFNSQKYKQKWYKLSKYVKDYICKSNKRFGYPNVTYGYGALDFKRYILNDPDKYIDTYGGKDIFYGMPENDIDLITSYKFTKENDVSIPLNKTFEGWYLDKDYKIGPISKIPYDISGDIKLFPKINEDIMYEISFNTLCDIEYPNIIVRNGDEVTLPTPSREGYKFISWEIDYQPLKNNFIYEYNVSIEIKARWQNNTGPYMEYLEYQGEIIRYRDSYIPVEIINTYEEKDSEFRAAWVSSFTSCFKPSTNPQEMKDELIRVLDIMESFNMNAILFHLRTHNNAFYKTKLAPIKEDYGNYETFEEWDYLPWFIDECHRRGIEFHAWLNPYRIALSGYNMDTTTEDISKEYQDCPLNPASNKENILMTFVSGKESQGAILDPSRIEVQDYIVNVCLELMENYNIDGIHFDDYFYTRLSDSTNILNDADQDQYERYIEENQTTFEKNNEMDKREWRRQNVDTLIYKLHTSITKFNLYNNRSVEFGISPTGVYKSGDGTVEGGSKTDSSGHYDRYLFSDTVKWVKEGWIDYILPQCYTSFNNEGYSFHEITTWWNKVVEGTKTNLYIGIGTHKAIENGYQYSWGTEPYEINNQLRYLNGLNNVDGVCFFSFYCFNQINLNSSNIAYPGLQLLKNEYWKNKVDIPETRASRYE